ncbi:response regulator transcription factor [Cytobacillus sp. FJAT-54145]|uniref:Response regulator transcription factor n=1 Tax=Cytobacillus spartinae TaxID=3299023 RepID=A0ABW6KBL2_9BACI
MINNVHIIEELLGTYSSYLQVPLWIVDLSGEIVIKANKDGLDCSNLHLENSVFLDDIKRMVENIKRPVLIMSSEEQAPLKYVLSPLFYGENRPCFLLAGPFVESNLTEKEEILLEGVHSITQEDKHKLIQSIEKVVETLKVLYRDTHSKQLQKEKLNLIKEFTYNKECKEILPSFFKNVLTIYNLDFIGFASKNTVDTFCVDLVVGEKGHSLNGVTFYIGEGLLGQSAAAEKEMIWNGIGQSNRAEIFKKAGLQPNHLFSYPIKNHDIVEGLVFGGKLKGTPFHEELHIIMKCFVQFLSDRKSIREAIGTSEVIKEYYQSLVDVMDVFIHSNNPKNLLYKVLEVCRSLNKNRFVCATLIGGELFLRGTTNDKLKHYHKQLTAYIGQSVEQFMPHTKNSQNLIHVPIVKNQSVNGILTMEVEAPSCNVEGFLDLLGKILSMKYCTVVDGEGQSDRVDALELLHASIKEWNTKEYQLVQKALTMAETFSQLEEFNLNDLKRAIKVVPYRLSFIKEKISAGPEISILEDYHRLLENQGSNHFYRIESQILGLIYRKVCNKEDLDIEGINESLKEKFEAFIQSMELNEKVEMDKVEISLEDIEKVRDVSSVIIELPLTSREQEVLHLVLEGLNNQEVASALTISIHTVKNHITNIFRKLNVSDRVQAMAKIYRIKYGME